MGGKKEVEGGWLFYFILFCFVLFCFVICTFYFLTFFFFFRISKKRKLWGCGRVHMKNCVPSSLIPSQKSGFFSLFLVPTTISLTLPIIFIIALLFSFYFQYYKKL